MINENISGKLEGIVLNAFQLFCSKRGIQTGGEGIRAMIRELPEYRRLFSINENTIEDGPEGQERNSQIAQKT